MFQMTNNMGMYDLNWFTDVKRTFIEKCLYENFDHMVKIIAHPKVNKHNANPQIKDHTTSHQNIFTMVFIIGTEIGVYL